MNLYDIYHAGGNIQGGRTLAAGGILRDGTGFAAIGKKGDIVEGVISRISEQVSIKFSNQEVSVPKNAVRNAAEGETRRFEILEVSKEQIVLKDISENGGEARPILCTQMEQTGDFFSKLSMQNGRLSLQQQAEDAKNLVEQLKNSLGGDVCAGFFEKGIDFEKLSPADLSLAVCRMRKENLEKQDVLEEKKQEKAVYEENISREGEENRLTREITQKLLKYGLPLSDANLKEVSGAYQMAGNVKDLSPASVFELVRQEEGVTPESIFKAGHAQLESYQKMDFPLGNVPDAKEKEELFGKLLPQIEKMVQAMDTQDASQNLADARWLLERELPVTSENLLLMSGLKELRENFDEASIVNELVRNMARGESAKDTNLLLKEENVRKSIQDFLGQFQDYEEETLVSVVAKNEEVLEDISSHLRLEELRLKMTTEAGYRMLGKGISLDTSNLAKIVEELEKQEREYYESFFAGKAKDGEMPGEGALGQEDASQRQAASIQGLALKDYAAQLKATMDVLSFVKQAPAALLGETLSLRQEMTLSGLSERAQAKQQESRDTMMAKRTAINYETMRTMVRADLGDSIKKAFAGVSSMLSEMGLEATEANQRAVRILGYNQMEITEENISNVKAYDSQVNALFSNLTPETAVHMIRMGINPLETPVYELNDQIRSIREENGFSREDKYSEYLWKLEQEEGITKEERSAYMGLYRLFNQVEQSDGAAIGMLLQEGREVTLSNLLEAVRVRKVQGVDFKADESMGALESLTWEKASISTQLAGFESGAFSGQEKEESRRQEQMVEELLSQMTPSQVHSVFSREKSELDKKLDLSLERFYEQVKEAEGKEADAVNEAYLARNAEEAVKTYKNSQEETLFLNSLHQPATLQNLMGAGLLYGKGRKLFQELLENAEEKKEALASRAEKLLEHFTGKEEAGAAYEELLDEAEKMLPEPEAINIQERKQLSCGLSLAGKLAREEHYTIPLFIGESLTTVNLTIAKDREEGGRVHIQMEREHLGNLVADFSIHNGKVNGSVLGDSEDGVSWLRRQEESFTKNIEMLGLEVNNLAFGTDKNIDRLFAGMEEQQKADTADLYRVAKAFIGCCQAA